MSDAARGDEPFDLIHTVAAATEILDVLADAAGPLTVEELVERADITESRCDRHMATLTHLGLVEATDNGAAYRLGWRMVRYGHRALAQNSLTDSATPELAKLRDTSEHAVFLSRRVNDHAVVWVSFESLEIPIVSIPTGTALDLQGTATGRTLLAHLDPEDQQRILQAHAPPEEMQSRTGAVDPADLPGRLQLIRDRGFDLQMGEDILTTSAPIFDSTNRIVAVITLLGFRHLMAEPADEHIVPRVLETAKSISTSLGAGLGLI